MAGPENKQKNENTIENRSFNEIDELARAAELATRNREKKHNEKTEASKSLNNSRGMAENIVSYTEYTEILDTFIKKYQNDDHLISAFKSKEPDNYEKLLTGVYNALFGEKGFSDIFNDFLEDDSSDINTMNLNTFSIGEKIPKALNALSEAEKNLEKSLLYEQSDKDSFTRELLTDMYDLHTTLERNAYGMLQVPSDDARKDKNGKRIHRVTQQKDITGKWIQPEVPEEQRYLASNDSLFSNKKDYPLFDHEPNETDVQQGGLGDCYFVSALASTAAEAPELIKDMMVFNPNDNTVTVRFYNENQEPVYVTVDNTVPTHNVYDPASNINTSYRPFAQRAHWVQIMEKAYTVSGLACNKLDAAEKGNYKAKYEDIKGGFSNNVFSQLFGYSTNPITKEIGAFALASDDNYREYQITRRNMKDVQIGKQGTPYTSTENIFYMILKDSFNRGYAHTASISNGKQIGKGLMNNHAYTMTGVEEDPATGKKYVLIRNPHANYGGEYDFNGKAVKLNKNADGRSRFELRGFLKTFDYYVSARHDISFILKNKKAAINETLDKYKKAVDFIHKAVEENDNGFLRAFGKNSPEFNTFRVAALKAYSQFRTSPYDTENMLMSVKDMSVAAAAYIRYRDNQPDAKYDDTASRSVNRYNVAGMAQVLGEAFDKMEAPDSIICRTVEPADLIRTVRERGSVKTTMAATEAQKKIENIEKKTGGPTL